MKHINGMIQSCMMVALMTAAACSTGSRAYAAPASGADTFKAKCAMCHGADGSGNTPMGKRFHISNLGSPEVQKKSDADLTAIITNGKPPMPAYGNSLGAAEIHELVAYIRTLAKS